MSEKTLNFTPYPDIKAILLLLLSNVQKILKDQFVGMYLYGSLARGDFNYNCSDIDFVVVTSDELLDCIVTDLAEMHMQIATIDSKWARELEGSYISRQAIRRYDPANIMHPHIDRGCGNLSIEQHDSDWVIQRYSLRESGVVLAGPSPKRLIDPIGSDELRMALLGLLWWWELQITDTSRVQRSDYQVYSILTMCRILYTLQYGTIVSKPAAARWVQKAIDKQWTNLIENALIWQPGTQMNHLIDTLDFIKYTLDYCRQYEKRMIKQSRF